MDTDGKRLDRGCLIAAGLLGAAALLTVAGFIASSMLLTSGEDGGGGLGEGVTFDPSSLPPREAAPVEASPLEDSDEDGRRLETALRERGIEGELLFFFDSGERSVYGLQTDGASAVALWERLRAATDATGYYPVILGDGSVLESQRIVSAEAASPEVFIASGAAIDLDAWIEEHLRRWSGELGEPHGDWPEVDERPEATYAIPTDILSGQPLAHIALALVPTTRPWEVPAWLGYGGWNDCPAPEAHVAMMKRWHDRYAAEVVGMSGDVVEMRVGRPPEARADAMVLAREQYAYCSDIVHQGTSSLEGLAAELQGRDIWFFWWD